MMPIQKIHYIYTGPSQVNIIQYSTTKKHSEVIAEGLFSNFIKTAL